PQLVVLNGDVMDGATISRHPRTGWEQRPTLRQELDACLERLGEIEAAAPKGCELIWTRGNHDARFETYLAANAPGFEGVRGMTLQEQFPLWTFTVSVMVNRNANGVHATYNNTLKSGINIVCGHLHQLRVFSWGDYKGRRYGVDSGTLA